MSDLRDRTRLRLVAGQPKTFPLALELIGADGVASPIDVSESPLTLHVHIRGDDTDADPVFDPIAVLPLSPNVAGYGQVSLTTAHVAAMAIGERYVFRLRKESGESLDEGDLYVDPTWE